MNAKRQSWPPSADLQVLATFLDRFEQSADAVAAGTILETRTLEDVLGLSRGHGDPSPFVTTEVLPTDRAQRVALLYRWLRMLPAFPRLSDLPEVKAGLTAFDQHRSNKRWCRSNRFRDDLAEARFWRLALHAVFESWRAAPREANAEERSLVRKAARDLLRLSSATTLLTDMTSLPPRMHSRFLQTLAEIKVVASRGARSRRIDAKAEVFIETLTAKCMDLFGEAPPSVVAPLAGLVIPAADTPMVKKRVQKARAAWEAKPRGWINGQHWR
ncbi:MAG: hypothetical protein AB1430_09255 [Pseudomonadota bacterium]